MKKIGICNNKGGVGKTTITLCLAGALAEMDLNVLLVDMDQQGSLSSSFLPDIHNLSLVVTDVIRDDGVSIEEAVHQTQYANIKILPSNLSLAKLESELQRLGTQVEVIHQDRERLAEMEHRVDELNTLRQRHVPVLNILRDLTREMPQDTWFSRIDIDGEKGTLEGVADSASALIPLLAASPLLKDVAFLSPITKDSDGKERFRIGFGIR